MNFAKREWIITGSVVAVVVLAFGIYFFITGSKTHQLVAKKDAVQKDLESAKQVLTDETETLNNMVIGLRNSFSFAMSIQDQIKITKGLVAQTDFLFTGPNGNNPKMIFKNSDSDILINAERRDINIILEEWQKKISLSALNDLDEQEARLIEEQTRIVQRYIEDITEIVNTSTPENSGLTVAKIEDYKSKLPGADSVTDVITSIAQAVVDNQNKNTQNNTSPVVAYVQTIYPEMQASTTGSFTPQTPSITPEDVIAQQAIVDAAQAQVDALQKQLEQINQQIADQNKTNTATTTVVNQNQDGQTTNYNYSNYSGSYIYSQGESGFQDLIAKPGVPQPLQGN